MSAPSILTSMSTQAQAGLIVCVTLASLGCPSPEPTTLAKESADHGPSPIPQSERPPKSDEFEGEADLSVEHRTGWAILHPERAARIDVGRTVPGKLTIVAENGRNWAWFADDYGTLVYRDVVGNFVVATRMRVVDDTDPQARPTGPFNAGGFVIRDPGGTHDDNENWVMFNFGSQGKSGYARETKKTVGSKSRLYLNPQPFGEGTLGVCRVGQEIHFYFEDAKTRAWAEERYIPGETEATGNDPADPAEIDTRNDGPLFFRHDRLPPRVQVGVMAHAWASPDPTRTRAEIDFVRFGDVPPASAEDCLVALSRMVHTP